MNRDENADVNKEEQRSWNANEITIIKREKELVTR